MAVMKLLLTNDDGIEAPGLEALFQAAQKFGEPVVVAPINHVSGCSHQVTVDQPIRIERRYPCRYAVQGTPADCVRVALHGIVPDAKWVLSGINEGGNLGADVHHSGTVAAVREAVLHGWPGIALSQYRRKNRSVDWLRTAGLVVPLVEKLIQEPWTPGTFFNINLPHLEEDSPEPKVVFCRLDPTPLPLSFEKDGDLFHYSGDYHQRRRESGTDVDVCFSGDIAVTKIALFEYRTAYES
jgi:5'-nucleotidase